MTPTDKSAISERVIALPTIADLFQLHGSSRQGIAKLSGFSEAFIAYSNATHVFRLLSKDPGRGLDREDTERLAVAAAKLIELENQAVSGFSATFKGRYIPELIADIISLSPHRDFDTPHRPQRSTAIHVKR
jgi:hypothetical protein